MRISGSVLPAAMRWAAAAGVAGFVLKFLQNEYMPKDFLGDLEISPAAYSGFSFTLGFVIVFRTSQCYNRFWTCATHVNAMRAEWYEAASGLTTFISMSSHDDVEQEVFCHRVIRYFSLMHSLALQALADGEEAFPVIDLESIPNESLQQMTMGMVNYNSVLDIISIPFPFPYAQVTFILLTFYVCFIPVVMCLLVNAPWIACICGFLSVLCLVSVDLVSTEIENPFGEDANDLPCHEFQNKMNKALMNLLHPAANEPPELLDNAKLSFAELMKAQNSFTLLEEPKFHGGKMKQQAKDVKPIVVPEKKAKPEDKPPKERTGPVQAPDESPESTAIVQSSDGTSNTNNAMNNTTQ